MRERRSPLTTEEEGSTMIERPWRAYDAARQTWNMKWLHALTGTWVDLGPQELGGVTFDGSPSPTC